MEEDLEISKIEYLNNQRLNLPRILNLSSGDQTKIKMLEMKMNFNGRWPLMEEDLQISKIEYLSNHWSDLPQILNLSPGDQTKIIYGWNDDDL